MFFKPAVAAPGGGILSTYPLPLGGFAVTSGTSMASHTAAVAALILKAKGKATAKGICDLLETTSKSISQSLDESAAAQTVTQQGAGLINAHNAITYTTVVTPGELLPNDTADWKSLHTIYIKNASKKTKTYTLKHVAAGTTITVTPVKTYDYLPRNDEIDNPYCETAVPGVFANGTTIPVGQYKTLLRVLKVDGNPAKEEDYEAWLSPVVGVVAA